MLTVTWTVNGALFQTNLVAGSGTVSLTAFFPLGTNRISISVSDPSDCAINCSTTVLVLPPTPAIYCGANKTNECSLGSPSFDTPSASNTCGTVSIFVLSTVTNLGCGNTFVATRTWLATDELGDTNFCSQTIATVDTLKPIITCGVNKTNQCSTNSPDLTHPKPVEAAVP